MGTGWRRAFCTSIPRDPDSKVTERNQKRSPSTSPSPRSCTRMGIFSSSNSNSNSNSSMSSNPSTPRLQSQPVSSPSLRCRTTTTTTSSSSTSSSTQNSPRLHCKTTTPSSTKSPRLFQTSNPSSPRSPLKFSLFKSGLRLSKSTCGICFQSVKTGHGTAIFTAECSHAFHFPCIAAHVRKPGNLVCPVCNVNWREVPLLASIHKSPQEKPEIKQEKKEQQQSKPLDSRAYDDDEPLLLSPRFNAIPENGDGEEGDEEEDDDEEEFQGFFVNPNPSFSIKSRDVLMKINGGDVRDFKNVEARLYPEVALISVGRNYETYAVTLKMKAPPPPPRAPRTQAAHNSNNAPFLDPGRRAPIDLVTVLDVSGSMTGAKLQMLKRAMRLVISSLGSADRLSIVAFNSSPKRLLHLKRMTAQGQRSARRIIDRLICGQGTSVGEALRKATKVLEDRRERNPVATIMLLSDGGQDDRGPSPTKSSNQNRSSSNNTRFSHLEIPVHAFNYGANNGNGCYSREPAEDAFTKCVGGLLSVVVQDLRLQLSFSSGAEVSAVYSYSGRPTVLSGFETGSVRLGDLYAEEERELLVEVRVPRESVGAHHVMTVRCCYKDPATQELTFGRDQFLQLQQPQTIGSSVPKIERLSNLFVTTRAVAESRRLVEHKEFSAAVQLLSSARALLMQSSSIPADEYVRGLESELGEVQRRKYQMEIINNQQRRRTGEREPAAVAAFVDENGEPLTPTSAWRAAEKLAKVAIMRKSLNRVSSDLHGFENARF